MLEYDRVDISEGIDATQNKLDSRECWMCHFWFFIDKKFNYQRHYCNGCHDMSMKAMSMQNLAVVCVGGNAYRINFTFMNKADAINLMKSSLIIDKKRTL